MRIKPIPPAEKTFEVILREKELEEIRTAFNHMLTIAFYTSHQRERIREMLVEINGVI